MHRSLFILQLANIRLTIPQQIARRNELSCFGLEFTQLLFSLFFFRDFRLEGGLTLGGGGKKIGREKIIVKFQF
jgi:hypothetical protein